MKFKFLLPIFAAFLAFASPVSAAPWTAGVTSAINKGDMTQIDVIAAENPTEQGAIAMFLLEQSQAKLATNPDLAADLFTTAANYLAQIQDAARSKAVDIILAVMLKVNSPEFQKANVEAAGRFIAGVIQMSGLANILAFAPDLKTKAMAWAEEFLFKNPQAPLKVKQLVSLAQTQGGGTPGVGAQGAIVPCGE